MPGQRPPLKRQRRPPDPNGVGVGAYLFRRRSGERRCSRRAAVDPGERDRGLRDGPGLSLESKPELRVVCEGIGKNLDGDASIEPCIPCLEYLAHSSRADQRDDFVGADLCAGRQTHFVFDWDYYRSVLLLRESRGRQVRCPEWPRRAVRLPWFRNLSRYALAARPVCYIQIGSQGTV